MTSRLKKHGKANSSVTTAFDHSVALCELHLHAMEAGANLYMLPSSEFAQEPIQFWQFLSTYKISYTFTPNSFLAAALRAQSEADDRDGVIARYDFQALKTLFCGGEANRTSTLKAACDFLCRHGARKTAVTAVYGLSETCSALFYNRYGPEYDSHRGSAFASVGVPLPMHNVRIVDKNLCHVKTGLVQLQGATVFQGYYNDEEATTSCTTVDGWFDTGDLGSLDDQGNLMIVGRSKDVLVLNGQNYSSGELEYAIETSAISGLETGYTVCFSVWNDQSDGEEIAVLFNPFLDWTDDTALLQAIVDQIIKAVVGYCKKRPHVVIPLPKSRLPRSSIGKLSRSKLRSSLLAGEFDEFKLSYGPIEHHCSTVVNRFDSPGQANIARLFEECFGIPKEQLHADLLIETLGIDSLGFLRLRSSIERALSLIRPLSLSQMIACQTIRDIDALAQSADRRGIVPYTPINIIRSTGSKTPLIMCHTGNGGFLNYSGLWPMLPDRRIVALRARGLEPGEQPFESLSQMLVAYVDAIKKYQPSGPYALFGLCFGGILAFELAKRLEAMGDEVLFCAGLDTSPDVSILRDVTISPDQLDERHFLMNILTSANLVCHDEVPAVLEKLVDVPRTKVVEEALLLFPASALEIAGLSSTRLKAWISMSACMHHMASDYCATGSVKTFDAFYVADPPRNAGVSDALKWRYRYMSEWKAHVKGASNYDVCFDYADMDSTHRTGRPLRFHLVPGVHEGLTTPGNVKLLGNIINNMLLLREDEYFT